MRKAPESMSIGADWWVGAGGATSVGVAAATVGRRVRGKIKATREATKRRNLLIDGRPAIPHISPEIIGMAERLENVEKVQTVQGQQLTTMNITLDRLERKFDGNGGNTMMLGDVIQRIAKKLDVWETK